MNTDWFIFRGETGDAVQRPEIPDPPQWRDFQRQHSEGDSQPITKREQRGSTFCPDQKELMMVNAALYLRRPLLVTGNPGTGKTSLAYAVAHELGLGEVLYWPITTRTTLKEGLYSYDAIGRIQDFQLRGQQEDRIGNYIRLGPLGTAFLPNNNLQKPKVLLIDEIDKSDIDLPNDLLHIFEEGEFGIPELERIAEEQPTVEVLTAFRDEAEPDYQTNRKVTIPKGRVRCRVFPFIILTSNGEREFPPAFLRRCLRLDIDNPSKERLEQIITNQLGEEWVQQSEALIQGFHTSLTQSQELLSTDQLLNAVYLLTQHQVPPGPSDSKHSLRQQLLRRLDK